MNSAARAAQVARASPMVSNSLTLPLGARQTSITAGRRNIGRQCA